MPFVHAIDPVLVQLGPLAIRWYGLLYALGFILTYLWVRKAIRQGRLPMTEDQLDVFALVGIAAVVLGARLFEAVFYAPGYYLANPWKVLAVWEGGLSFHGGLVGILLAGAWFMRKHGIRFLQAADVFVIPIAFAQALGRVGNFINGELPGRLTSLPWGVQFPRHEGFRHPSQLYEAGYNLIITAVLLVLWRRQPREGRIFAWFLLLYGVFRFLVEFLKEMQLYGPLTMGQWLTLPMLGAGAWLLLRK
jgi:phosphatidylglycerol:prolipoprotein diacylglycerol transferase